MTGATVRLGPLVIARIGATVGAVNVRIDDGHPRGTMIRWFPLALLVVALALAGCAHVKASDRERLASPAMQFEMDPVSEGQTNSILEITEGSAFPSAGPGTAGAGCGCN